MLPLDGRGFLALNAWPPARDYVAQMKYKPPPRFNAGFLIPDGRGRASLVGRLLPQPTVRAEGRDMLLDEVLGRGFALLLRTASPAEEFAKLRQPVWDRLGALRVGLLPEGAASVSAEAVTVATETDGALAAAMAPYAGCALLLRPDHYVAAAVPLAAAGDAARAVDALLAATWTETQDQAPRQQAA